MADALARYRQADTQTNALDRYKRADTVDLGALAKYLGLTGYWDRQGALAQGGLDMAEEGAQQFRDTLNPIGLAKMVGGPLAYIGSPVGALLPTEQEAYAARDLPEWSKPGMAGILGTAMAVMPGPKFKGLGKGMSALADDATAAERAALEARLQSEAGQVGGAPSAVSRDQALTNLTQAPEGITAYHGSPHTFDKFDMSKIGTGEGAQAYGHGLYFAENEGVAKSYRDALAKPSWQVPPEKIAPELADLGFDPKALELARDTLRNLNGDGYQAVSALDGVASNTGSKVAKEAASAIRSFNRNATREGGATYQVRLNVKPDELLDWDKPLGAQSATVDERLKTILKDRDRSPADWINSSPGAEQRLREAGIKGIRYKDAGSRGAEGGTYNFVIFDPELITILKRYGIPITLGAGGAAMVNGADMPPEVANQISG